MSTSATRISENFTFSAPAPVIFPFSIFTVILSPLATVAPMEIFALYSFMSLLSVIFPFFPENDEPYSSSANSILSIVLSAVPFFVTVISAFSILTSSSAPAALLSYFMRRTVFSAFVDAAFTLNVISFPSTESSTLLLGFSATGSSSLPSLHDEKAKANPAATSASAIFLVIFFMTSSLFFTNG